MEERTPNKDESSSFKNFISGECDNAAYPIEYVAILATGDHNKFVQNIYLEQECRTDKESGVSLRDHPVKRETASDDGMGAEHNFDLRRYYQQYSTIFNPIHLEPQPIQESFINLGIVNAEDRKESDKSHLARLKETQNWSERYQTYEDMSMTGQAEVKTAKELFCVSRQALFKHPIIISGRAGIGKSTFCQYVAFCWSMHGSMDDPDYEKLYKGFLPDITQLYVVALRQLKQLESDPKMTDTSETSLNKKIEHALTRFFKKSYTHSKTQWSEDAFIITDQEKTLYIMDGFDEVVTLRQNGLGYQLLTWLLNQPNIIITLRPCALSKLPEGTGKSYEHLHLELMGFQNEDIPKYVRNVFALNCTAAKKSPIPSQKILQRWSLESAEVLIEKLQQHPAVWGVAHVPLHLALICALKPDKVQ